MESNPKLKKDENTLCGQCRNTVVPGSSSLRALGFIWHSSCFLCFNCNDKISQMKFLRVGGEKFCSMPCLKKAACTRCGRLLREQVLKVSGQKLHPRCFTCQKCKQPIRGDYVEDEHGGIFCAKCG